MIKENSEEGFAVLIFFMLLVMSISLVTEIWELVDRQKFILQSEVQYFQSENIAQQVSLQLSSSILPRLQHCQISAHGSVWFENLNHWQNGEKCELTFKTHRFQLLSIQLALQPCWLLQKKTIRLYEVILRDMKTQQLSAYMIAVPEKSLSVCSGEIKRLSSSVLTTYHW